MEIRHQWPEPCAHVLAYQNEQRLHLFRQVEAEIDEQLGSGAMLAIVGGIIQSGVMYFNDDARPELREMVKDSAYTDAYFQQRVLAQLSVLVTVAEKFTQNQEPSD